MLGDSWVNQRAAKSVEPFEGSHVIQPYQAAVSDHVCMQDGDQLPPPDGLPVESGVLVSDITREDLLYVDPRPADRIRYRQYMSHHGVSR
jgi:hypothetical protein